MTTPFHAVHKHARNPLFAGVVILSVFLFGLNIVYASPFQLDDSININLSGSDANRICQTFQFDATSTVTGFQVRLRLDVATSSDLLFGRLVEGNADLPCGVPAFSSDTATTSVIDGVLKTYEFNFPAVGITTTVVYSYQVTASSTGFTFLVAPDQYAVFEGDVFGSGNEDSNDTGEFGYNSVGPNAQATSSVFRDMWFRTLYTQGDDFIDIQRPRLLEITPDFDAFIFSYSFLTASSTQGAFVIVQYATSTSLLASCPAGFASTPSCLKQHTFLEQVTAFTPDVPVYKLASSTSQHYFVQAELYDNTATLVATSSIISYVVNTLPAVSFLDVLTGLPQVDLSGLKISALRDKLPFVYFYDIIDLIDEFQATTTQKFPTLVLDFNSTSTQEMAFEVNFFSTSTIYGLVGKSRVDLLMNLVATFMYFAFAFHLYNRVKGLLKTTNK